MPDGNTTVIIQGKKRFEIAEVITEKPYMNATIREAKEVTARQTDKEFTSDYRFNQGVGLVIH